MKVKIADEYDEVTKGNGETVLEFNKKNVADNSIKQGKRKTTRENINDWLSEQLKSRKNYDAYQ